MSAHSDIEELRDTPQRNRTWFAMMALALLLTGCGSVNNTPHPLPIALVLITAPPVSMQAGATATVMATVSNDAANRGVSWSCAPSNLCGSFAASQTASGTATTYTAPASAPQGGSVTVTATAVSDTMKSASANVAITTPPIAVTITTIPPATMQTNASANVAATVSNDTANKGVTWSCAPSASCGSFSVTQTGSGVTTRYTAPAAVPQGSNVTITATSVSDKTNSASANVTITVPPIAVTISTPPPATMQINASANVAATVSNDAANKGVTWSCAPSASCGSFSATQTASGVTTTYTAPAAVPQGNVTITATSVSDVTQTASANVTITTIGSNASLKGQYAFLLTGIDHNYGNYALGGSLTFDGNGNITTGVQDLTSSTAADIADPVTGTYTVGADGRGTMSLNVQVLAITETFAFTITSSSHAVLNEDDGTNSGSGALDLQSAGPGFASSQFSGGYSFTLYGQDLPNGATASFGGVFTADGASNLQAGTLDGNDSGVFTSTPFTATFTPPDANGRGTISSSTGAIYAYYLVRPGVIRLVETDTLFVVGGTAYSQGAALSFSNSSLTGRFVFNNVGACLYGSGSFAAAGQFVTDGNGNFTGGVADANVGATVTSGSLATSTYSFNNSPRGTISVPAGPVFTNGLALSVYLVDPNLNLLDPNNASGGGGALILSNDANIFGTGIIVPQANPAPSMFAGNYAINLITAPNWGNGDLTGQVVAQPSGNLSGTADYSDNVASSTNHATNNATYTGTFAADGTNPGRFTGTALLTGGTLQYVPGGGTQNLAYYQADASRVFVVEIDANVTAGVLVHQ